jgi:hypothetical protein
MIQKFPGIRRFISGRRSRRSAKGDPAWQAGLGSPEQFPKIRTFFR